MLPSLIRSRTTLFAALLVAAAGCNKAVVTPPDSGPVITGTDAGSPDSGPGVDAGTDAGTDAGLPLAIATITSPTASQLVTTDTPTFAVSVTGGTAASVAVTVTVGTETPVVIAATGSGSTWSATPTSALTDGHATATAVATNADGEAGPTSSAVAFTIDGTQPSTPVITAPSAGTILTTSTPTFTITAGSSAATVVVTITEGSSTPVTVNATNNGNGTWSGTSAALSDGSLSATAVATDALGYASATSGAVSFVIDTHEPAAPVITAPTASQFVTSATPSFVATAGGTTSAVTFTVVDSTGASSQLVATTTETSGTWAVTASTALANGVATVSAVAQDALGGTSHASTTVTFTVDTNEPSAPTITSPTGGQVVTTLQPTFTASSGGSTAAVTITVTDSSGTSTPLTATLASGVWSATPSASLALGHASVVAVATDALGGSSQPSASVSFTVDPNVPGAPTITSPADGAVVTSGTPPFVVSAPTSSASVSVIVTDTSGPVTLMATSRGGGTWTAVPTVALANGTVTASAVITDALGDSGPPSSTITFIEDTNAPAVSVTSPESGAVVTTLTPTFTVSVTSGTAASVSVTVTDSSGAPVVLPATQSGGTWTAVPTSPLVNGAASVTASALDTAGNSAGASAAVLFSIDTNLPAVSVTSPASSAVVTTQTPKFTVVVTSSTVQTVTVNGTDGANTPFQLSATNQGNGTWTATPGSALAAGSVSVSATATDSLNNSATSSVVTFTIDGNPPPQPVITSPTASQLLTTSSPTFTVSSGGSTASVTVTVTDSTGQQQVLTATGSGGIWTATLTSPLPDGATSVSAVAVDSINGLSPVSATVDFVVDTHVPVAPTITAPAPGQIVRTLTPSIHITSGGTTSAVSVSLTDSGGGTHTLVAGENLDGTWTAIPLSSLPNGATSVIATATDDLGGTSPASATINFIIDTNEPAAPVITAPTSGELLTTSTPSFDVTAGGTAFSVTVTVTDSSGIPLQITASSAGSGLWSAVPPSALADGVASVTAFATDTLGGTSPASTTVTFTIDTHEPAVPTITSPTSGQVVTTQTPTFAVASGGTTSAVTLTVTDSSGVPVQLSGATSTTPGVWTATPVSPLADGHATVSAVATDALGGSSEESTVVSFVVDTNVPVAPTITDPPAGKVVTSQTPTFEIWSGGSTASVAVTVTDSGGNTTSFSARNNGAGSWSATATTPLAVGLATVSAVATDDLGGSSPPSTSVGFTVDPNLPAVAITTPTSSEIVMTLTPTFVATVTSGTALSVTITVTDGSGNPTQLTANPNGDGTWSATPSSALVAGASSIFAVATDALTDSTTSATVDFSLNLCQGAGGCFSCPPTTTSQFLNQCTGAQCSGFDNATRIPSSDFLPDGGLIPL